MQSGLFTIRLIDIADAVLTAVFVAVLGAAVQVVTTAGFDVFSTDWITVGKNMINLSVIAGVLTLGKSFLTTNSGRFLGVGPAV